MSAENYELPAINGDFTDKHIVSIDQFSRNDVEMLMSGSLEMLRMVDEQGTANILDDLVFANLFYEPSTRTFLSFEAAAKRLGAKTISTQGVEYSSIAKGETLVDTIQTVDMYADTIALRHNDEGAAKVAAGVSQSPIINGGDGVGEHPTQAFTDIFTILSEFGQIDDLRVTMVGDLANGRTVHSLALLLGKYSGVKLNYVSPPELKMPQELIDELGEVVVQEETTILEEAIEETDVLYMTRIQEERFENPEDYERHKQAYTLDSEMMKLLSPDARVLHPLPRKTEIHHEVDGDRRAVYFDQVENGMFVRMDLLAKVNGRSLGDEKA